MPHCVVFAVESTIGRTFTDLLTNVATSAVFLEDEGESCWHFRIESIYTRRRSLFPQVDLSAARFYPPDSLSLRLLLPFRFLMIKGQWNDTGFPESREACQLDVATEMPGGSRRKLETRRSTEMKKVGKREQYGGCSIDRIGSKRPLR